MGCIYLITNIINGKRYVGQTRFEPEIRLKRHFWCGSKSSKFKKDFDLYGKDVFDLDVLCWCDNKDLNYYEKYWIFKLNTIDNGYNTSEGGQGPTSTIDEEKIVDLYNEHRCINTVSEITGHRGETIHYILKAHGITPNDLKTVLKHKFNIDEQKIIDCYEKYHCLTDVCKELHHTAKTVRDILNKHGIKILKQSEIIRNKKFGFTKQFENIPVYTISKKDKSFVKKYDDIYSAAKDIIQNGKTKASTEKSVRSSIRVAIKTKMSMYGYYWSLENPIDERP